MLARAASLTLICGLIGCAAQAAERCAIKAASYRDADAATILAFRPVGSEAASVSHLFNVTGGKLGLDGYVAYDAEIKRSTGMVFDHCPEGDVTGNDLRACTVWSGIVYAVDAGGRIDVLGPEGSEAPAAVLMPGLGPAIRQSRAWNGSGLAETPWDLYVFDKCNAA